MTQSAARPEGAARPRGAMLDAGQISSFWADGYLRIEALIAEDEVREIASIYDRILADRDASPTAIHFSDPKSEGDELWQIFEPEVAYPELRSTAFMAAAEALAAQLLSVGAQGFIRQGSHMVYKPPLHGRDTPWHQDEAYWPRPDLVDNEANALTVWMPLDLTTVASGCMQFIPGSHGRVVPHSFVDADSYGLAADDVDVPSAVACELSAGGATVHHCRTLHYTGPNRTSSPRRAWAYAMEVPPTPRREPDPRAWLPELQRRIGRRVPQGKL